MMFTSGHATTSAVLPTIATGRHPASLDVTASWPQPATFIGDPLLKLHYADYSFIMPAVPDLLMSHQLQHHSISGCNTGAGTVIATSDSNSVSNCNAISNSTSTSSSSIVHHIPQQQQQQTPQKDTTFTKIFVGGLPYHTTDKSLKKFFEAFGEIEEAVVITDRQTGKSRGYGFVTMAEREDAERAVKDANPIIDGRKANVNLAYLGAKPRNNTQNGLPFPIRGGYPTVIPTGQFGIPTHHYVYHPTAASPYIPAAPSLILPNPTAPLTPTHFFDYPPAAYPPPPHPYSNGFESAATYAPFHPQPHPGASIGNAAVAGPVATSTNNVSTSGPATLASVNQNLFNV